jgi:hypothetical protein
MHDRMRLERTLTEKRLNGARSGAAVPLLPMSALHRIAQAFRIFPRRPGSSALEDSCLLPKEVSDVARGQGYSNRAIISSGIRKRARAWRSIKATISDLCV